MPIKVERAMVYFQILAQNPQSQVVVTQRLNVVRGDF